MGHCAYRVCRRTFYLLEGHYYKIALIKLGWKKNMNGITKTILVALSIALMFGAVSAAGGAQVVKLVAKDAAWNPITDGAFGSIMYQGDKFTFNAHGLTPGGDYTLINYVDPWGSDNVILGAGVADKKGNILLKGGSVTLIKNAADIGGYDYAGAKIWLVPSADLTGVKLVVWNPQNYLFETSLII